MTRVSIKLNDRVHEADIEPRTLLVDFIRDAAGLKGTHVGCETGHCGACTVILDGKAVKSCQIFAVQASGSSVLTVEGLAPEDKFSVEQDAFMKNFAIQCGYCTPGMLMTTRYLISKYRNLTRDQIRDYLHGNYCMCTGYNQIVDAIEDAQRAAHGPASGGAKKDE